LLEIPRAVGGFPDLPKCGRSLVLVGIVPLRVVYADDHPIVRQGCRVILEREGFDIVGEAADGREALQLTELHRPDAVVLDHRLPRMDGIDAARAILRLSPTPAVVLLTMYTDEQRIVSALDLGIGGYVAKSEASSHLADAIRAACDGRVFVSPRARSGVVDRYLSTNGLIRTPLGPKDRVLLRLIAEGQTSSAIAPLLGVRVKSVETYRARLMDKLDIHDVAGLVRYAARNGIIEPALLLSLLF
jgi:DNA-binding NarL/FixJ family response regulator